MKTSGSYTSLLLYAHVAYQEEELYVIYVLFEYVRCVLTLLSVFVCSLSLFYVKWSENIVKIRTGLINPVFLLV